MTTVPEKEPVIVQPKPFWQSASFRGVLIAILPFLLKVLRAAGIPIPDLPAETLVDLIIQGIGYLYAFYGIFRRKDIELK
jgi:hypothetical protein